MSPQFAMIVLISSKEKPSRVAMNRYDGFQEACIPLEGGATMPKSLLYDNENYPPAHLKTQHPVAIMLNYSRQKTAAPSHDEYRSTIPNQTDSDQLTIESFFSTISNYVPNQSKKPPAIPDIDSSAEPSFDNSCPTKP